MSLIYLPGWQLRCDDCFTYFHLIVGEAPRNIPIIQVMEKFGWETFGGNNHRCPACREKRTRPAVAQAELEARDGSVRT